MAERFDLSRQQVSQLLKGIYLPSLPTAWRMAVALDVTIDDLIAKEKS